MVLSYALNRGFRQEGRRRNGRACRDPPDLLCHPTMKDFAQLYSELDGVLGRASEAAGLKCLPGCGACCRRPSRAIEASPAELAPMARRLWTEGRGADLLDRARRLGAEGWCAVYEAGPSEPVPQGRCGAYADRPLTCRLFGFSSVRHKDGSRKPLLSAPMKNAVPGLADRVAAAERAGAPLPEAAEWRLRLAEADPSAAVELLPLNEALARALEAEGLRRRLSSGAAV